MKRRRRQKLPQELVIADILRLSHEGRGITEVKGKTVFVDGALPGEQVSFQYTRCHRQYDEAKVIEVFKPSSDRVQPPCAVFGLCGGCSLQHMNSSAQIKHKQNVLADQFEHFGHVTPQKWISPLTANQFGYRHKARLGVRYVIKKGGVLVGFREKNGHFLTDMSRCEILHPSVGDHITELRQWLETLTAKDQIPQLEVAIDDKKTALIIRHLCELSPQDIENISQFAQTNEFWIYLQPKGPDSIHPIWPKNAAKTGLYYELPTHNIRVNFQPQDFTQVNTKLNQQMVNLALQKLELNADDVVLDLFCGLGNFSLPIARYAKKVIGVEGDEPMTMRALANAQYNQLTNTEFHAANLFDEQFDDHFLKRGANKLLLDPPRAGAEAVIKRIGLNSINHIVYISCNPATLARDAGLLVNEQGFKLVEAGVIDMFPHTTHVESIAVFKRYS